MIPPPQRLARVTLEVSLKPFLDLSDAGVEATCRQLWRNWRRLAARAEALAVLLWVGTGDEVLAWSGREDDVVPTTQTIGFNNMEYDGAYDPDNEHYQVNRAQPYHPDPPTVRYGDLKRIIAALRRTGEAATGLRPEIGATIDPGPEFAPSPWRYERHREVLQTKLDGLPYPMWFITHQATLEADDAVYAGFPGGLPAGTGFGTFLGRQFEAARRQLGFDFLWLSNGLGYSHHPWISRGNLFDGHAFHPDRAAEELDLTNRFWSDLREETDAPVEVRGTNFTVGMDLATDGCSLADIAEIGGLKRPPCNPPWGSRALGLEMASYLSRLANTPTDRLPFRFYLNDPWFAVVPWYDYYAQEPFDCYVPMAASRLADVVERGSEPGKTGGGVDAPTDLNLLTVDTARGELLEDQAGEITPHLLAALDARPDAAGAGGMGLPVRGLRRGVETKARAPEPSFCARLVHQPGHRPGAAAEYGVRRGSIRAAARGGVGCRMRCMSRRCRWTRVRAGGTPRRCSSTYAAAGGRFCTAQPSTPRLRCSRLWRWTMRLPSRGL